MIFNNRQLNYALQDLSRLKIQLSVISDKKEIEYVESEITKITKEIEEYKILRDSDQYIFTIDCLEQLPSTIQKIRIARGITQRYLAETLGVAEQQVQRWEAKSYQGLSFDNLCAILSAMEVQLGSIVYEVHKKPIE